MSTVEQRVRTKVAVEPFGIEIDHPRNCNVLVQSIPGCRLRSAISASKPAYPSRPGEQPMIPVDQATYLGRFPPVPGMELHVNPAKLSYMIVDPLYDNEELCAKIKAALELASASPVGVVRGQPPQKGELDEHRMKTLCREMIWLVQAGEARVVKGTLPTLEQVEELPGRFLLNPGSTVRNSQPVYEDEFEQWVATLSRQGG